jgi:hypothetical protein
VLGTYYITPAEYSALSHCSFASASSDPSSEPDTIITRWFRCHASVAHRTGLGE